MKEPRKIALLSSAHRALSEAKTVDEVKDLRDKIAQYDTDIAEINRAIDESIARNTKTMQEIKNLKNRNKQIERELAQVEREKITYNRQLARLEKQQGTTGRSTEAQRAQKIAEKKHLQSQEDELVRQIHQTQQLIETRAGQQPDTLASLSKELAQVRQDNSLLQDKVADLDQTTQGLQRENVMVAALLDVQKDMQARPPAATVRVQPEGAPQTSNTMEAMGYALAQQGRYQEAIDYYQKALKHRGNKKDIYFNIGFIYYKMGNLRQAIRYYTYALRADPRNEEIKYTIELLKEELALSKRRK